MTKALASKGIFVNHKRVARLMRENGLNAIVRKKRNYFCSAEEKRRENLPGNTLNREFEATRPGEKLVSDVTYLPVKGGGWCYVSLVKDLCTRAIVAVAMSRRQDMKLAFETLERLPKYANGGLFHTDQGYLYTNAAFGKKLAEMGCEQSLSRRGNCYDNAVIESFNGSMKCEWFYPYYGKGRRNLTYDACVALVKDYVRYYNEDRIQKKLGYLTPMEYHRKITQ